MRCATQEPTAAADATADAAADAANAADAVANADADTTPAAGAARATVPVACMRWLFCCVTLPLSATISVGPSSDCFV